MESQQLQEKFNSIILEKNITKREEIEKEAKYFFNWCMIKGFDKCLFPEYLVKNYNTSE